MNERQLIRKAERAQKRPMKDWEGAFCFVGVVGGLMPGAALIIGGWQKGRPGEMWTGIGLSTVLDGGTLYLLIRAYFRWSARRWRSYWRHRPDLRQVYRYACAPEKRAEDLERMRRNRATKALRNLD